MAIRGFLRAFRLTRSMKYPTAPTSVARTARDSMNAWGPNRIAGGLSGSDAVFRHVDSGHENYTASFKDHT